MRKIGVFIVMLTFFISCKEELAKKPERLIGKDVMVNIIYDISVLDAIRYQNPTSIDSFKINSRDFILKKYKVDSLQFVKSNMYYSADYEGYKTMFDQVIKRVNQQKAIADSLIKLDKKKKAKKIKKTKTSKVPAAVDTVSKERKQFVRGNSTKESMKKSVFTVKEN